MEYEKDLEKKIRDHYQANHSIRIGACASVPLREIVPRLMERYPGQTVSAGIQGEEELLRQFREGSFQIIILTHPLEDPALCCRKLLRETMYFSVMKDNPLAGRDSISLRDIDGQTILLYSRIGFWYELCRTRLPHSRLLLQDDFDVFWELANASEFPYFISSWHLEHSAPAEDRVCLPISDPEMDVVYYCICRKGEGEYIRGLSENAFRGKKGDEDLLRRKSGADRTEKTEA